MIRACPVCRAPAGCGGIEIHRHATDQKNDHAHCWLLGGPCSHDGSNLAFSDRVAPLLDNYYGWPFDPSASTALLAIATEWADHHLGVVCRCGGRLQDEPDDAGRKWCYECGEPTTTKENP